MAAHSSNLAWRIPWTGGAWWATDHGAQRVRYDLATKQQHSFYGQIIFHCMCIPHLVYHFLFIDIWVVSIVGQAELYFYPSQVLSWSSVTKRLTGEK